MEKAARSVCLKRSPSSFRSIHPACFDAALRGVRRMPRRHRSFCGDDISTHKRSTGEVDTLHPVCVETPQNRQQKRPKIIMLKSTFVTLALSLLFVDSVAADQSWQRSLYQGSSGGYPYYSKTCVVPHKDGQDDSAEIVKVFQQCNKDAQIVFKEGVDYNMWSPMAWTNLSTIEPHCISLSPDSCS